MNVGLVNAPGELVKEDEWCVLNGINPEDNKLIEQIALNWGPEYAYALHYKRGANDIYRENVGYFANSEALCQWKSFREHEHHYKNIETIIIDLYIMIDGVPTLVDDIDPHFTSITILGDNNGSN